LLILPCAHWREMICKTRSALGLKYCANDTSRDTFGKIRRSSGQRAGGDARPAQSSGLRASCRGGFCADLGADLGAVGEVFQLLFAEPPIVLFLPPGEENKTIKNVEGLLREMARAAGIAAAC